MDQLRKVYLISGVIFVVTALFLGAVAVLVDPSMAATIRHFSLLFMLLAVFDVLFGIFTALTQSE